MSNKQDNEHGERSTETPKVSETHEQPPPEGSVRSLLRKASDFAKLGQRVQANIDSYPKSRRYVHIKVNDMYPALVALYDGVFAAQWSHFKRVAEAILPHGTETATAQTELARLYISHWIIDLYCTIKICVSKLTPVAYEEKFFGDLDASSNEYDAYLVALNAAIRPTHVVGTHEDVMFIPLFPDNANYNDTSNPFGIQDFRFNPRHFKSVILAIKDKRASWRTATLSTEVVGRPSWLFDWHATEGVFSWFPMVGNYNSGDVAIAFIIGVACTPHLAHFDEDDWRFHKPDATAEVIDALKHSRVTPRVNFGDFEINTIAHGKEKFDVSEEYTDTFNEGQSSHARITKRKRTRNNRAGGDSSTPGARDLDHLRDDDDIVTEYEIQYSCAKTYLYYGKVIFRLDDNERYNSLLAIIFDPSTHCTQ